MTGRGTATSLTSGISLLERAMGYTLGAISLVTPGLMRKPTPYREWDLRTLLLHMNHSLATMHEAIAEGYLGIEGFTEPDSLLSDPRVDPVACLKQRACLMMGSWAHEPVPGEVSVAGRPLSSSIVAATGAVEVAVHGWDVSVACAADRAIPRDLAEELLDLCHVLVGDADRPISFATVIDTASTAEASDRLLGFLGRRAH
jgi:uncharacterized protein (TIGR03086 family)